MCEQSHTRSRSSHFWGFNVIFVVTLLRRNLYGLKLWKLYHLLFFQLPSQTQSQSRQWRSWRSWTSESIPSPCPGGKHQGLLGTKSPGSHSWVRDSPQIHTHTHTHTHIPRLIINLGVDVSVCLWKICVSMCESEKMWVSPTSNHFIYTGYPSVCVYACVCVCWRVQLVHTRE